MERLLTIGGKESIHHFFNKLFPLRSRVRGVAFLFSILLISGCGGEESVDKPMVESVGGEKPIYDVPISSPYYPMTLGSRWVYRNPDGSEWAREVSETKKYGDNLYHFFSSDPPLQDAQIESLRSPVYVAFLDRLDRRINANDTINDAVWEIIVESGGGTKNWGLGMTCVKKLGRKPWCVPKKNIFKPGILAYLYNANTSVVWHSKLTLLPFPLVPGKTYQSLNVRLRGRNDTSFYIHAYEAEGVILGKISDDRELVETPAGAFQDCLKIQYDAKLASYRTEEFRGSDFQGAELEALESETREELTDLLMHLMPKLGLQTVWLAPGIGPVKIETPNGIAELIDYEIK